MQQTCSTKGNSGIGIYNHRLVFLYVSKNNVQYNTIQLNIYIKRSANKV